MLVGVISDTHDNLPKVGAAAAAFRERGVEVILHAGDYVAPFALKLLLKAGARVVGVFGNNDGERTGLRKVCPDLHEPPHRLELAGRTVVMVHDPQALAQDVADGADLLVCGHTHGTEVRPGPPLLVNPGEAAGWLTGRATAAVVDLEGMTAEIIDLGSQETVPL